MWSSHLPTTRAPVDAGGDLDAQGDGEEPLSDQVGRGGSEGRGEVKARQDPRL